MNCYSHGDNTLVTREWEEEEEETYLHLGHCEPKQHAKMNETFKIMMDKGEGRGVYLFIL